jgi:hypothetical protein
LDDQEDIANGQQEDGDLEAMQVVESVAVAVLGQLHDQTRTAEGLRI